MSRSRNTQETALTDLTAGGVGAGPRVQLQPWRDAVGEVAP
jgi:hypothetical protein